MIARILCSVRGHDIAERARLSRDREALVCQRCDVRLIRYDSAVKRDGRERWRRGREVEAGRDPWNVPLFGRLEPMEREDLTALERIGIRIDAVRREDDCYIPPPANTRSPIARIRSVVPTLDADELR